MARTKSTPSAATPFAATPVGPTGTSTRVRKERIPSDAGVLLKIPYKASGVTKKSHHTTPIAKTLPTSKSSAKSAIHTTNTTTDSAAGTRKCLGCKSELESHLFLALHPKNAHDFKEKCFQCRRVDAVGDYVKTHTRNGSGTSTSGALSTEMKLDHLENQKEVCAKWKRIMANRGIDIADDILEAAMNAVKEHVAMKGAADPVAGAGHATITGNVAASISSTKITLTTTRAKASKGTGKVTFKLARPSPSPLPPLLRPNPTDTPSQPTTPTPDTLTAASFPAPTIPLSTPAILNPCLLPTAASLHRAAHALDLARHLPAAHFELVASSVFRRPFEAETVAAWADMLSRSVELALGMEEFVKEKGLGEEDVEAVVALCRFRNEE